MPIGALRVVMGLRGPGHEQVKTKLKRLLEQVVDSKAK